MTDHKELSNELKAHRKQRGLTQAELAEAVQVSRKSVNAVENGVYVPSTVLALKMARALGCKVEDLFRLPEET